MEARAWIGCGGEFGGDSFAGRHTAAGFVDELYAAGATLVEVDREALVVSLPADATSRARVIDLYNREVDALGEEFGGDPPQGHELSREEALASGCPEAEGQWCVDDFHLRDLGQARIRFWWD